VPVLSPSQAQEAYIITSNPVGISLKRSDKVSRGREIAEFRWLFSNWVTGRTSTITSEIPSSISFFNSCAVMVEFDKGLEVMLRDEVKVGTIIGDETGAVESGRTTGLDGVVFIV